MISDGLCKLIFLFPSRIVFVIVRSKVNLYLVRGYLIALSASLISLFLWCLLALLNRDVSLFIITNETILLPLCILIRYLIEIYISPGLNCSLTGHKMNGDFKQLESAYWHPIIKSFSYFCNKASICLFWDLSECLLLYSVGLVFVTSSLDKSLKYHCLRSHW